MNTDLALIAIAAGASTSAILTVVWHFHVRSYKRTLDRVRARRDAYKVEVRELREERLAGRRLSFAEHAATVVVDEPIACTLTDPAYMPVFDGDNPAVREYASTAAAIRKAGAR